MKTNELTEKLNYYMKKKYRIEIVEDEDEGGFVVSYPDLIGCISSGETLEEAVKNGEDARREWIYAMLESGAVVPDPLTPTITPVNSVSVFLSPCTNT